MAQPVPDMAHVDVAPVDMAPVDMAPVDMAPVDMTVAEIAPVDGEVVVDALGEVVAEGELAEGEEEGEMEEPDFSGTFTVFVKGKEQELEFDKLGYAWSEEGFLVDRYGRI